MTKQELAWRTGRQRQGRGRFPEVDNSQDKHRNEPGQAEREWRIESVHVDFLHRAGMLWTLIGTGCWKRAGGIEMPA